MGKRWKVVCAYDGTEFCGWQVQPNGVSVQALIETQLHTVLKAPVRIHGSGRTDSGVHARGQVFHFDAKWDHEPAKLLRAIQSKLPESILLKTITTVAPDFHARFSATGKCYTYRVFLGLAPPESTRFHWSLGYGRKPDLDQLQAALQLLEGWHDFKSFAVNRGQAYENTWRCITTARSSCHNQVLTLTFEGNGFLYKMVRGLTGAVLSVATGQLSLGQLQELIDGRTRKGLVVTAPGKGLCLEKVYYRSREYPQPPSDVTHPYKSKTLHSLF